MVVPLGLVGGLASPCSPELGKPCAGWSPRTSTSSAPFPPLVLLIFIAFGLPFAGLDLPPFAAVAVAFLLNTSSYYGEIYRAGIESIPRGQFEAARSTGLSGAQTMAYVIVPQATRNVLPDLVSNTLEVVKLTSIASVVALPELLYAARHGAVGDLQRHADHRGGYHLPRLPLAAGAPAFALRAPPDRAALMKKILVIHPNSSTVTEAVTRGIDEACEPLRMQDGPAHRGGDAEEGPPGIETQQHVDAVIPHLLQLVKKRDDYDAFVIACYSDPGLHSLREATRKPVLGIAECGILTALTLGQKFGVIAILERSIPRHLRYMGALGVMDRLAAELAVGLGVTELADENRALGRMAEVGRKLRETHGANVIVMGCAGMARYRKALQRAVGVPVVEPTQAAVAMALGRVRLGWE